MCQGGPGLGAWVGMRAGHKQRCLVSQRTQQTHCLRDLWRLCIHKGIPGVLCFTDIAETKMLLATLSCIGTDA